MSNSQNLGYNPLRTSVLASNSGQAGMSTPYNNNATNYSQNVSYSQGSNADQSINRYGATNQGNAYNNTSIRQTTPSNHRNSVLQTNALENVR